jgi:hypothetical protein
MPGEKMDGGSATDRKRSKPEKMFFSSGQIERAIPSKRVLHNRFRTFVASAGRLAPTIVPISHFPPDVCHFRLRFFAEFRYAHLSLFAIDVFGRMCMRGRIMKFRLQPAGTPNSRNACAQDSGDDGLIYIPVPSSKPALLFTRGTMEMYQ